ncbi:hypothetical protein LC55x_2731 [Lysobacter capsici]|nr:hypothetical protein LC55x_2731 [Lysobacter capsici]
MPFDRGALQAPRRSGKIVCRAARSRIRLAHPAQHRQATAKPRIPAQARELHRRRHLFNTGLP